MKKGICSSQQASQWSPLGTMRLVSSTCFSSRRLVVVRHLARTVVHINHGVRGKLRVSNQAVKAARGKPDARRKARRARIHVVKRSHRVQAHQPAHARPRNPCRFAPRQRRVLFVNHAFQRMREPVHRRAPAPADVAELRVFKREGGIFAQPPVIRRMVAVHRNDNQRRVCRFKIFLHSPALPVGRVGIEENVMAIEHVQHRIARFRVLLCFVGDVHIDSASFAPAQLRDWGCPFFNHDAYSSVLVLGNEIFPTIV